MAAIEIKLQTLDTYPVNLFEDNRLPSNPAKPFERKIKIQPEHEAGVNPKLIGAMYQMVEQFDQWLPESVYGKAYIRELKNAGEVGRVYDRYISNLKDLSDMEGTMFALPMGGAYRIMDSIAGKIQENAIPVWIGGTDGTSTGHAVVQKPLPDELTDPGNLIVYADDVFDTSITSLQIAAERLKMTGGFERANTLVKNLQELHDDKASFADDRYLPLNEELAVILEEANLVIAPLFDKNAPATKAIRNHAEKIIAAGGKPTVWAYSQLQAFDASVDVDQGEWVMGAGLLDTDVSGEQILEILGRRHEDDQAYAGKLTQLRQAGFDRNFKLRLGAGLENLVVFDGDIESWRDLAAVWVEENINRILDYIK